MSNVRQVEELMFGNALAAESTTSTFIDNASDKELAVVSSDGTAAAAGKPFKILQKTNDPANKAGYEFSDKVDPSKVDRVTVKEYSGEVQKQVKVTGFTSGNVVKNTTYVVEIRLFNPNGALSTENFEIISGYYVTGQDVSSTTAADVRDGLIDSLNSNLRRRGDDEFTVTDSGSDMTITGKYQVNVPGKIEGRMIEFDVNPKTFDNSAITNENLGLLTASVEQINEYGSGTGKYASNKEWFTKGFKYDVYRDTAYPANFEPPYYANKNGMYNVIHVHYFSDRTSPTVERQYKTLTTLVEKANDDLASNAQTNAVLGELRTIMPSKVPSDLATS